MNFVASFVGSSTTSEQERIPNSSNSPGKGSLERQSALAAYLEDVLAGTVVILRA